MAKNILEIIIISVLVFGLVLTLLVGVSSDMKAPWGVGNDTQLSSNLTSYDTALSLSTQMGSTIGVREGESTSTLESVTQSSLTIVNLIIGSLKMPFIIIQEVASYFGVNTIVTKVLFGILIVIMVFAVMGIFLQGLRN